MTRSTVTREGTGLAGDPRPDKVGFSWEQTWSIPLVRATYLQKNRFFPRSPNGDRVVVDADQSINLTETGGLVVHADPKSLLGDVGTELPGQMHFLAHISDIVMTQQLRQ